MNYNKDEYPGLSQIDEEDEYQRLDPIQLGFEQELKSITVQHGDSARFEAKVRLVSTSPYQMIDRSLLNVEWRFNDIRIRPDHHTRYQLGSNPDENRYWMKIQRCQQTDEKVYTIYISYDHERYHDESSAYLFVQGK